MKINKLITVISALLLFGFLTTASAAVSEPGAFKSYLEIFLEMIKGTAGNLVMVLIIIFAGIKAWQVGDKAPLMWGAAAVIAIAAAPSVAPNLTENINSIIGF